MPDERGRSRPDGQKVSPADTKNLRVVQLLLGHTKLESTVRYLGIEVDDALEISNTRRYSGSSDSVGWGHVRSPTGFE